MNSFNEAEIFTPKQVSEYLQLNIITVYSYIRSGILPAIKLGRTYRITKQDFDKFLETNRTHGKDGILNE